MPCVGNGGTPAFCGPPHTPHAPAHSPRSHPVQAMRLQAGDRAFVVFDVVKQPNHGGLAGSSSCGSNGGGSAQQRMVPPDVFGFDNVPLPEPQEEEEWAECADGQLGGEHQQQHQQQHAPAAAAARPSVARLGSAVERRTAFGSVAGSSGEPAVWPAQVAAQQPEAAARRPAAFMMPGHAGGVAHGQGTPAVYQSMAEADMRE